MWIYLECIVVEPHMLDSAASFTAMIPNN